MAADQEFDSEYLFKLARDKSAESRASLARVISDLFEDERGALSDRERSLMYGILHNVVREVEMSVRQAVASRLADENDVPRELLTDLANDSIEVAYPILNKSGLLRDEDLMDVIRLRTLEHQMAIAARQSVSEAVSDALVGTGEETVVVALLNNQNAKISERTMEYLVEQSKRVDTFQEPIVRREDLRPELAKKMFLWVSAALRQHILDKYSLDSTTVDDLLESVAAEEIKAASSSTAGKKKTQELAEVLRNQGLISPDMLITALKEGEVPLFLAMFCRMTDLREYLANRILFEAGGEGLAIACKAVGIGKAVYSSIFTLSQKAKAETATNIQKNLPKALAFFDKINAKAAEDVLQRWRRGSDYLSAIRQLQQRIQSNA